VVRLRHVEFTNLTVSSEENDWCFLFFQLILFFMFYTTEGECSLAFWFCCNGNDAIETVTCQTLSKMLSCPLFLAKTDQYLSWCSISLLMNDTCFIIGVRSYTISPKTEVPFPVSQTLSKCLLAQCIGCCVMHTLD
jgi:hypothetical protein